MALAQSTKDMDWSHLELVVFAKAAPTATGLVCLPADNELHELTLTKEGDIFKLAGDPLAGKVAWKITQAEKRHPAFVVKIKILYMADFTIIRVEFVSTELLDAS